MRVIVAGSRSIKQYNTVAQAIEQSEFDISEIVSGTAYGVDSLGEQYGLLYQIKVKRFPAAWGTYGKRAGIMRNIDMAKYADALIAVWDGTSKGTKHMIETIRNMNKPIYVFKVQQNEI